MKQAPLKERLFQFYRLPHVHLEAHQQKKTPTICIVGV